MNLFLHPPFPADVLRELLSLNQEVARRIAAGEPVTPPGGPEAYGERGALVTADCVPEQNRGERDKSATASDPLSPPLPSTLIWQQAFGTPTIP